MIVYVIQASGLVKDTGALNVTSFITLLLSYVYIMLHDFKSFPAKWSVGQNPEKWIKKLVN